MQIFSISPFGCVHSAYPSLCFGNRFPKTEKHAILLLSFVTTMRRQQQQREQETDDSPSDWISLGY